MTAVTSSSALEYAAYELTNYDLTAIQSATRVSQALGPRDVLVQMKTASLNYRDLLVCTGRYRKISLPRVPLSDGVGEVMEVGQAVTKVKVGMRVSPNFMTGWTGGTITPEVIQTDLGAGIDGVLRQYAVFDERSLVKIPDYLSDEEAATLPCAALTAWNGLIEEGNLKAGETVLVMGSGGVSIFAMQFALMSGAEVIATSSSDEKLKRLKKMGAAHVINYKSNPDWDKEVVKFTRGRGVDHVIEVGGSGTLEKSAVSVKVGGHISLIGVLANPNAQSNHAVHLLMKAVKLQGIFVGSVEMYERMNAALTVHKTKPVIDKVFDAHDVVEALRYMQSGAHFGKVVLKI
ncbi:NAD(P)-dependent alcohol dehydrogenase [Candidatus Obscuribacterales bacterium]|nr:NAD(P)-dependent alcohol dehydrogenase [Candidatus Obscuribacterales bacterium]